MIIYPAIDLKDGRCVRLLKGDFSTVHQVADSRWRRQSGLQRLALGGYTWWIWMEQRMGSGKMAVR